MKKMWKELVVFLNNSPELCLFCEAAGDGIFLVCGEEKGGMGAYPSWCMGTQRGNKFLRSIRAENDGGMVIVEQAIVGVRYEEIQKDLIEENLQFVLCSSPEPPSSPCSLSSLSFPKQNFVLAPSKIWESKLEQIKGWWKEWGQRERKIGDSQPSSPFFSMLKNVPFSSLNEHQFAFSRSLSALLLHHLFSSLEGTGGNDDAVVVCLSRPEEYQKVGKGGGGFAN